MWNLLRYAVPVMFVVLLLGCSSEPPPVDVTPPDDLSLLKGGLQDIADSGELGSGVDAIPQLLESLKASDSAKGEELTADFAALQGLSDPAKIKAKAKAMLGKL